jgi:hypothetical protein
MSSVQDEETIERSLELEALRLLTEAKERELPIRLLGGMGIKLLLGARMDPLFSREIDDLDFITTRRASRAVERFLDDAGWEPQRRFNALHGNRRLMFYDPRTDRRVDVFVGSFQMCHSLPLLERMLVGQRTLPAAELLISKLQIVRMNAKDMGDLYALLNGLQVAEHDHDAINAAAIAKLTGADWGLHHTCELSLARLLTGLCAGALPEEHAARIAGRVRRLQQALQEAPKSRAWRVRARIGEHKRWYEEPEEVNR